MNAVQTEPTVSESKHTPRTILHRLAGILSRETSNADRAALRRLRFEDPGSPVFWKIVARDLNSILPHPDSPLRGDAEKKWAVLLAGLAEIAGAGLCRQRIPLGKSAALADIHELRVTRLLRAHGDSLLHLVQPFARQLVSKRVHVDWSYMGDLILSDQESFEEQVRRDLARSYYSNKKSP